MADMIRIISLKLEDSKLYLEILRITGNYVTDYVVRFDSMSKDFKSFRKMA